MGMSASVCGIGGQVREGLEFKREVNWRSRPARFSPQLRPKTRDRLQVPILLITGASSAKLLWLGLAVHSSGTHPLRFCEGWDTRQCARLAAKGIQNTGSTMRGGVVVTAGGIIFVGTQGDRKFRAYDKDAGAVRWEKELPAAPNGVPAVFEVAGREYVVICAQEQLPSSAAAAESPAAVLGKSETQGYYVFALPTSTLQK